MPKRGRSGNAPRTNKRKRAYRGGFLRHRRKSRARIGRPSRGLRQSTYLFKRSTTEVINLVPTGQPSNGWLPSSTDGSDNGIFKQWQFSLAQLPGTGTTDFTNLFKRYKINAVKLEMAFSNTGSNVTSISGAGQASSPNAQLQVYTTPNRTGRARNAANPLTEAELMNTQAKRKRLALNGGKPLKFFMKVSQLGMIYVSPTDTDYAVQKPEYISTSETGAVHYGLEMYINRVDGQPIGTAQVTNQVCRITTTYYLSFKGVE